MGGGTDGVTGAALLNRVVLAGWRTGAQVHVFHYSDQAADPGGV